MHAKGLTLTELLVVTATLGILVYSITYTYVIGIKVWDQSYSRSDIRGSLSQAMELISKDLRQAKNINSLTQSSITFTADLGAGDNTYRFYLYNSADPEPNPPYTQSFYELRWAQGAAAYGTGAVLARDIVQPVNTPFSLSNNLISIDLTAARSDESVRLRSNVRPRNL